MFLGLKGMYKLYYYRIVFMNDLGNRLKVKFWYIFKRMRVK